jgi:hypothetical protein
MNEAVVAGALAVAALNGLAAADGLWSWWSGAEQELAGRAFWLLLRIGQGAVLTLAIAVASLTAAGKHSHDHLFYLYALLPIAIAVVAEQLRIASAQAILDQRELEDSAAVGRLPESEQHELMGAIVRRELGVMALSALVVVFLALRAAGTAHGF